MCCGKAAKADGGTEKRSFSAHQAAKPHPAYKRIQNAAPLPGVDGTDVVIRIDRFLFTITIYGGRPTRLRRSAKRGSERSGSHAVPILRLRNVGDRAV